MEKKLTKKQKKILEFISKFVEDNSYPPTLKEIAAKFKLTIGTIQDHVFALQRKGYLEKKPDTARGFKIIKSSSGDQLKAKAEVNYIPLPHSKGDFGRNPFKGGFLIKYMKHLIL